MQSNSVMKLEKYFIENIRFAYNTNFDYDNRLPIYPKFSRSIKALNENQVEVKLGVMIGAENEKYPFFLNVSLCGVFYLEKLKENDEMVKHNTIAILFPYLRSIVTLITANANLPPFIIPVMNIIALFENDNNKHN